MTFMVISMSMNKKLKLPSYAKINLVLRILGQRSDGFHTLQTILQTIDLQDQLTFEFESATTFDINLKLSDPQIPTGESNLIYRACQAFHKKHPLKHRVNVKVEKRIPMQSGLG